MLEVSLRDKIENKDIRSVKEITIAIDKITVSKWS